MEAWSKIKLKLEFKIKPEWPHSLTQKYKRLNNQSSDSVRAPTNGDESLLGHTKVVGCVEQHRRLVE